MALCLALAAWALLLAGAWATRSYGNYDFQVGFYTALKEVLLTKEFDVEYSKYFSKDYPIVNSLLGNVDTCDMSRFEYTPQEYFVTDGTMETIFKNKEVHIGYLRGMDLLTKFEVDMAVKTVQHMIHAYGVQDEIEKGDDKNTASLGYELYSGSYHADMDANLSYDNELGVKITVSEIGYGDEFSVPSLPIQNYDIILGVFEFSISTYETALGNVNKNINVKDAHPYMYGCNTMVVEVYNLCLPTSGKSNQYAIVTLGYKPSSSQKIKTFGKAMTHMLDEYGESSAGNTTCVYVPYELAIFTQKHASEVCSAYASSKDKCNNITSDKFTLINVHTAYRVAPIFNFSLPISETQDQDYTKFANTIDALIAKTTVPNGKDAIDYFVSQSSVVPKTREMVIPYALEFTLSSFMVGTLFQASEEFNENVDFRSYGPENENVGIERQGREFLGNALLKLSAFYGRNIGSCSCTDFTKYTRTPIAPGRLLRSKDGSTTTLEPLQCSSKNKPDTLTIDQVISGLKTNTMCQLGYSGIVWSPDKARSMWNEKEKGVAQGIRTGKAYDTQHIRLARITPHIGWKMSTGLCCPTDEYNNQPIAVKDDDISKLTDSDGNVDIKYIAGTGLEYVWPSELKSTVTQFERLPVEDEDLDKSVIFAGFEAQFSAIVQKMLESTTVPSEEPGPEECDGNPPSESEKCIQMQYYTVHTLGQGSTDNTEATTSELFSPANFVTIYAVGPDGYKLNSGIVDKYARTLGLAGTIVSAVILLFILLLIAWRVIRMTCGHVVPQVLRTAAEDFEEKRDERWCGRSQ